MDTREFINKALGEICSYVNRNNKARCEIEADDIYIVWVNKTANNNKGIFAIKNADYLIEVTSINNSDVFILDYYEKVDKEIFYNYF